MHDKEMACRTRSRIIPKIPNFQLRPKHIFLPPSAQIFQISLIHGFIGCPQSVHRLICRRVARDNILHSVAIYGPSLRQFIENNLFLRNLAVDLAARFSQNFGTRASSHRNGEVWLKSFNFKSFCALKIILFSTSASTQLANKDHSWLFQ